MPVARRRDLRWRCFHERLESISASGCQVLTRNQILGRAPNPALRRAGQRPASQMLALERRGHATAHRGALLPRPGPARGCVAAEVLGARKSQGRQAAGAGRVPSRGARPSARPSPTPAAPRRRDRAHARTPTRTHGSTPGPHPPAPALPLGGDPPRRQLRLRLPACVYNFVLLPRPPCSWKGGGGMWKAAARRLTGGSSGGLRRRPERPPVAVPRALTESCVLPPRP